MQLYFYSLMYIENVLDKNISDMKHTHNIISKNLARDPKQSDAYILNTASCTNAHSNEAECEKWAAEGECQINSRWMPKNCQKSCHMCGKDVDKPTETPDTDDDQDGQYTAKSRWNQ